MSRTTTCPRTISGSAATASCCRLRSSCDSSHSRIAERSVVNGTGGHNGFSHGMVPDEVAPRPNPPPAASHSRDWLGFGAVSVRRATS